MIPLLMACLGVLVADLLLNVVNQIHQQRHAAEVPAILADLLTPERVRRGQAYHRARTLLARSETLLCAALWLVFLFGGGLGRYDALLLAHWPAPPMQGMVFACGLLALRLLVAAPFAWYRQFRLEERYGFNTMSSQLWLADAIKATPLALFFAGLAGAAFPALLLWRPDSWWLWGWTGLTLFSAALIWLAPWLIEPLFHRFRPLTQPDLLRSIQQLADTAGLAGARILSVDASRRSRHSNAYFTGLGRQRRIVLYDNLVNHFQPDEILAVLAHEMGHWRHHHLRYRFLWHALVTLAGFLLAQRLWLWGGLPGLVGLNTASPAAQGLLLLLLMHLAGFFLAPLGNALARRQEWQADVFARHLTGRPDRLADALVKLARDNLIALHPHPWYVWFNYSHPPLVERLEALRDRNG